MGREVNNACEFSCDEAVIKKLDSDGVRAYGNTLLNALGFGGGYKSAISSVTLSENKKILMERLDMIKNFKKKSKFAALCAVLLTIVLGVGAGVVGVNGRANPPANFVPPPPGRANIMHDFIYGGEEIFRQYGIDDELGITTDQGNIYYRGELVHEVVFYTHYRGGNWMVLRSADTASSLVIYIRVSSFEPSGRVTRFNVVEHSPRVAASYSLDEIFVIRGDLVFHVPHIAVGEEVLLGRIDFEYGQVYQVSVEAAEGQSVFVGVNVASDPRFGGAGRVWSPFQASWRNSGRVTATITHCGRPRAYLYVGSNVFSGVQTDLTDVTVRVTMLP